MVRLFVIFVGVSILSCSQAKSDARPDVNDVSTTQGEATKYVCSHHLGYYSVTYVPARGNASLVFEVEYNGYKPPLIDRTVKNGLMGIEVSAKVDGTNVYNDLRYILYVPEVAWVESNPTEVMAPGNIVRADRYVGPHRTTMVLQGNVVEPLSCRAIRLK
jgi:hypothetical protein